MYEKITSEFVKGCTDALEFYDKYGFLPWENKEKYKCTKCNEILKSHREVIKHKKKNWDHFEYNLAGTSKNLAFA